MLRPQPHSWGDVADVRPPSGGDCQVRQVTTADGAAIDWRSSQVLIVFELRPGQLAPVEYSGNLVLVSDSWDAPVAHQLAIVVLIAADPHRMARVQAGL